ncbi:MAG: HNH endonuclease [Clostridium sp.]|nr:HNH endonuclease [Clostridium sp.]
MAHKYTPEQRTFFRENISGFSYKEIQTMFADRFGFELTETAVKSYITNHKLKTGTYRKYGREHIDWLQENIQGTRFKDLTQMFNACFGFNIGVAAMISLCDRFGLHNGIDSRFNTGWKPTQFKKGHVPANKGKKGISYPGCETTQFKKGNMPQTWKPVGTETVRGDGYTWVKIAEPNKWREKHRLIWEAANGPTPQNHAVIFADGDKQNNALENLILVSRAQLVRLNQNNLIAGDAELTKTGILVADVISKVAQRRRIAKRRKQEVTP